MLSMFKLNRLSTFAVALLLVAFLFPLNAQQNDIDDNEITNAIETELWIDAVVNVNRIDVETNQGIVLLTGQVSNILAKERAEKIAEGIMGVRGVIDRIEVKPYVQRTDRELRDAVQAALLRDPATESYKVSTTVDNGIVTVSGTVDSWQEKELVLTVIKGVKGVRGVKNEVDFQLKKDRPDGEIEREIEARLANDIRVDDYQINVNVEDGKVRLSGTAGSLTEKNRAVQDCWVSGVEDVKAEDLEVEWWARDEMRRKSMFQDRSDQEIKNAVEAAFLYDPRVMSFNPVVEVNQGTVTLKGMVDNLKAKQAAEADARNVIGVWRVNNLLKVRPAIVPTDLELKNHIVQAFINDPYVERPDINIETNHGVVYLNGKVNTSFEKFQAELVAETVLGVVDVENNLTYNYEWTWKPDREIKSGVKDQLKWSLFVDSDDIDVSVDDGVVTLEGEVNNWSEYDVAEKNAYEGGAKDVENKLSVIYPFYGPYNHYPYWPHPIFK